MIDMGMGQHDRVDLGRVEAEGAVVQGFKRARSLEQPAVDKDGPVAQPQFHARARDRACRAVECQSQRWTHANFSHSSFPRS